MKTENCKRPEPHRVDSETWYFEENGGIRLYRERGSELVIIFIPMKMIEQTARNYRTKKPGKFTKDK